MEPCIEGVKKHISTFVTSLEKEQQLEWDLRFEFLAHQAGDQKWGGTLFSASSVQHESINEVMDSLYTDKPTGWFTSNLSLFQDSLNKIKTIGDEASLVGLDIVLDLPWRNHENCHRVVIFMSDEPLETGVMVKESEQMIDKLIRKIMDLKVSLFLVTPDSPGYESLSAADKCEWEVVTGGHGLVNIDYGKLLGAMAKSVSKSQLPLGDSIPVSRALFGQDMWVSREGTLSGQ